MLNLDSIPVNGGTLLACAAYAALTYTVSAPLIAERSIEKTNWIEACTLQQEQALDARRPQKSVIPNTDCASIVGSFVPELAQLCRDFGNPDLSGGATQRLREQERRVQESYNKQRALAATQINTRCDCAVAVVSQDRAWWVSAATWRLYSTPTIDNLDSSLMRALHSPMCAGGAS